MPHHRLFALARVVHSDVLNPQLHESYLEGFQGSALISPSSRLRSGSAVTWQVPGGKVGLSLIIGSASTVILADIVKRVAEAVS